MTLKNIYRGLFYAGLFFFPFNEYEGIPFMGEFRSEPAVLFFIPAFLIVIIEAFYKRRISIPVKHPITIVLFFFLIWAIVATLFNIGTVSQNYFKQTTGINRFFRQYASLLISTVVTTVLFWNALRDLSIKEILYKIRRIFLFSLIIASIYGFLEIMVVVFNQYSFLPILKLFDYFPFLEVFLHSGRISSITFEPPSLAIYLITISGWMFSYVLTEKKGLFRFLPTIAILVLTFYSGSRTALITIFAQLLVFCYFLYRQNQYRRYLLYGLTGFAAIFSVLVLVNGDKIIRAVTKKVESLDFGSNLTDNVSNQSRFGMQSAMFQVFLENPITGVGFGQQTYHSRHHYPRWATKNNYEFRVWYNNKREPSFPPGYNLYLRQLAETGLIGLTLILTLVYVSVKLTLRAIRNTVDEQQVLAFILMISFAGLYINWIQIDSFRIYGIWLCLVILIRLTQSKQSLT